tara:strand:+ start:258 stop:497 length:240 start_codon:yes stop_codon:yes gene_type:complete
MDTSNFLTSREYNTIAVKLLTDCMYEYNKKEYDDLLDKLFYITKQDIDTVSIQEIKKQKQLKEDLINKPLTDKPLINNS